MGMDKITAIQMKIRMQEEQIDRLEEEYYNKKKNIRRNMDEMTDKKHRVERFLDEEYQRAMTYIQQNGNDKPEAYQSIEEYIALFSEVSNTQYVNQMHRYEDELEVMEKQYRKQRYQLEDELEESYAIRRRLYLQERKK